MLLYIDGYFINEAYSHCSIVACLTCVVSAWGNAKQGLVLCCDGMCCIVCMYMRVCLCSSPPSCINVDLMLTRAVAYTVVTSMGT